MATPGSVLFTQPAVAYEHTLPDVLEALESLDTHARAFGLVGYNDEGCLDFLGEIGARTLPKALAAAGHECGIAVRCLARTLNNDVFLYAWQSDDANHLSAEVPAVAATTQTPRNTKPQWIARFVLHLCIAGGCTAGVYARRLDALLFDSLDEACITEWFRTHELYALGLPSVAVIANELIADAHLSQGLDRHRISNRQKFSAHKPGFGMISYL